MRNLCIFISVFLMSFAVHGNTTEKEALNSLLIDVYEKTGPVEGSALTQIKGQLQNYLPTCPLEIDSLTETDSASATEGSDFLKAVSCDQLMDRAKASLLSRFKMQNLIMELGEEGIIDEARQEELLASLEEIYGPESSQKAQEREQLISHFQNCDADYNWVDAAKFWSEAFGCKGVIETAREAGVIYSDIQDAIDAALSDEAVAQAEVVDVAPPAPKPRQRTSKP